MTDPLCPSDYWDREATNPVTPPDRGWMANGIVRRYINASISGDDLWPLDWFQRLVADRTFDSVLSIGCGTGALERDLVRRGLATRVDAFDGSRKSIEIARADAAREGLEDRIDYFVGDFNTIALAKESYDLVCFHQSLHHVQKLERLLFQVRRALRKNGLVYLDEFIGPSRTYWTEPRVRWYRALYEFFPREGRYFDSFGMPIQYEDPSEAVRSSEIVSRLCIGFEIVQFRGYGGNILAMLFPDLIASELTPHQVETMIASEKALIAAGSPHFYAVIVARAKRGAVPSMFAALRYFTEDAFPESTRRLRDVIRQVRSRETSTPDRA